MSQKAAKMGIHHDTAPVQHFHKHSILKVSQPPYSPDMAPVAAFDS
jgi:hypothetical protein